MATLILEQDERRQAAVLNGRCIIGRRAANHINLTDRSVSRIHAWIAASPDGYFIADTASRTGTKVNGQVMRGRRPLQDGDKIEIGSARMTYHSNGTLPEGVEMLETAHGSVAGDDGIFIDCACGAPIWVPWAYAGRIGRCRDCNQTVQLPAGTSPHPAADVNEETIVPGAPVADSQPTTNGEKAPPELDSFKVDDVAARSQEMSEVFIHSKTAQAKEAGETFCGACQCSINVVEATTVCPECHVAFHKDCWNENGGCSSYGCKQVNSIKPKPVARVSQSPATESTLAKDEAEAIASRHIQWGYLLLPGSVLAALGSILTFGIPSLLLALGIVVLGLRSPKPTRKVSGFALLVSIVGAAAGSGISTYWWLVPSSSGILRP